MPLTVAAGAVFESPRNKSSVNLKQNKRLTWVISCLLNFSLIIFNRNSDAILEHQRFSQLVPFHAVSVSVCKPFQNRSFATLGH